MARNVERNIKKLEKKMKKNIMKGLEEISADLSSESLGQCPLDTGDLRESYRLTIGGKDYIKGNDKGVPNKSGEIKSIDEVVEILASYDTPYALVQHEEMSYYHPTPGTKAKYLEDPLKNNKKKYIEILEDKIKQVIK